MAKHWEENFEALLNWLNSDRDRAGIKYEQIRESLINIFSWRGFRDAEDLADETISRVTAKVVRIAKEYQGDPALYFYAVAKKLFFEAHRRDQRVAVMPATPPAESIELIDDDKPEYECLDQCLNELLASDRQLILLYYHQDGPTIGHRKELAQRLGCTLNAMRIKVCRIRLALYSCMEKCLGTTH